MVVHAFLSQHSQICEFKACLVYIVYVPGQPELHGWWDPVPTLYYPVKKLFILPQNGSLEMSLSGVRILGRKVTRSLYLNLGIEPPVPPKQMTLIKQTLFKIDWLKSSCFSSLHLRTWVWQAPLPRSASQATQTRLDAGRKNTSKLGLVMVREVVIEGAGVYECSKYTIW